MCARVSTGSKLSDPFHVTKGMEKGCILAPLLFILFYAAMLKEAMSKTIAGIYIDLGRRKNYLTYDVCKPPPRFSRN